MALILKGETYDCPACNEDLTPQIDRIDAAGWGDGAEGTCTCPKCGAQIHVVIAIVKQLTVTATVT